MGQHGQATSVPTNIHLADVVSSLTRHHSSSSSPTLTEDNDVCPSKHLPATGLKRNTEEFKVSQQQKQKQRNNGHGSRRSSQSSIPSAARGSTDERTAKAQEDDQEGAEGRGPGRHEKDLMDGKMVESPENDVGVDFPFPSISESQQQSEDSSVSYQPGDDQHVETGGAQSEDRTQWNPEERMNRGDSKKYVNEVGKLPNSLPGVKDENPPGPQNVIVMDARILDLHVSVQMYFFNTLT
jgi:hypothetical protein